MQGDGASRLRSRVAQATQNVNSFIENSRPLFRAAEDSLSMGGPEVDLIVSECETIIGNPTSSVNQKFLALFLVKELSRRLMNAQIFASIKGKLIDRLTRLVVQTKGRQRVKECGGIFDANASGEAYEKGVQFYQLASECISFWAEISSDPEIEMRRREVKACPEPISPFVYFDRGIEDLQVGHAELARLTAGGAAVGQSQQSQSLLQSGSREPPISLPDFIFSDANFSELERNKRSLLAALNRPVMNREEVDDQLITIVSVFDGNKKALEDAIVTAQTDEEMNNRLALFQIVNTILENAAQLSSAQDSQIRSLFRKVMAEHIGSNSLHNTLQAPQNSYPPAQNFGQSSGPSQQLNWSNTPPPQQNWQTPSPARPSNSPLAHSLAPEPPHPFSPSNPNFSVPLSTPPQRQQAYVSQQSPPQPRRFDIEGHDEVIRVQQFSSPSHLPVQDLSPEEVELLNRELKARKTALDQQMAELRKKERQLISENRAGGQDFFRHDTDPKLLIEEISRKNIEYDSLKARYEALIGQMDSKVRTDLILSRSIAASGFGVGDGLSRLSSIGRQAPKYRFKGSQFSSSMLRTSYY